MDNGNPIRRIAENCRDVFCPDPQDFQAVDLWSCRAGRDQLDPNNAPPHLVEDLLTHQPLPDGGRWVSYEIPVGWPGRWVVRVAKSARRKVPSYPAPRVARYLRFSLQCRIPAPLRFTVPLAERFRQDALKHYGRANGGAISFALSGHNRPEDIDDEHQHAFYLPLATDRACLDFLTELHVWCPYGLTQAEVEALMRVHRLDWGGGKHSVKPVLMAIGNTVPDDCQISIGQTSSRIWRSRTPFVPPRYFYRGNLHGAKLKAKDAPEQQLALCLRQAGIDTTGEIRRLTPNGQAQRSIPPASAWDIVRAPEGEEKFPSEGVVTAVHVPSSSAKTEKTRRIGLFFELTFDAPVTFPMPALGHSCHFGLGLFTPAMNQNIDS
jgi:CRISPR-associated protein Csb2